MVRTLEIEDPQPAAPGNAISRWMIAGVVVAALPACGVLFGIIRYFASSPNTAPSSPPPPLSTPVKICVLGSKDPRFYNEEIRKLSENLGTKFAAMLDDNVQAEFFTSGEAVEAEESVEFAFRAGFGGNRKCGNILNRDQLNGNLGDPFSTDIAKKFLNSANCLLRGNIEVKKNFIIGQFCDHYILVGGGFGVSTQAALASHRGAHVIPAWGSGGAAGNVKVLDNIYPCNKEFFSVEEPKDAAISAVLTPATAEPMAKAIVKIVRENIEKSLATA